MAPSLGECTLTCPHSTSELPCSPSVVLHLPIGPACYVQATVIRVGDGVTLLYPPLRDSGKKREIAIGAGFLESRPRKRKELGGRKWAMKAETGR